MADDKIDFSTLDPAQEPERWAQLVESVAQRALAARVRPHPLLVQFTAWSRPAFALAAGLAAVIWCAGLVLDARGCASATAEQPDAISTLATWAANDTIPAAAELTTVLGGGNGGD